MKDLKTKFYHYDQNNSGGYFVRDKENGITTDVIIEASDNEESWAILREIGARVDGFWDYCSCCGERWYDYPGQGKDEPSIYGEPINIQTKGLFREECYVHYKDGTIKHHVFQDKDNN